MNITPERTAIKRSGPSRPLQDFLEQYEDEHLLNTWLDYGCGHGADLRHLIMKGIDAYGYDPLQEAFEDDTPLGRRYDVITCNYVVNVIPEVHERATLISNLFELAKPGGVIMISARTHEEVNRGAINGTWTPLNDGWITSKGTFQAGITNGWLYDQAEQNYAKVLNTIGGHKYSGLVMSA